MIIKYTAIVSYLFLLSGTISPIGKFSPYWLLSINVYNKLKIQSIYNMIIVFFITILLLLFSYYRFAITHFVIFLTIFLYLPKIMNINAGHLYKSINRLYYIITSMIVLCQVIPLNILYTIRSIFINDYYLEDEHLLRSASILSEPSDHFIIVLIVVSLAILADQKIPFLRTIIIAFFSGSAYFVFILPLFIYLKIPKNWFQKQITKFLYVTFAIFILLIVTILLIGSNLNPADASRFVWLYVALQALIDNSFPNYSFETSGYLQYIPSEFRAISQVLIERVGIKTIPNAPGIFLLIFYKHLGLGILFYLITKLAKIKQNGHQFTTSVYALFVLMFIQSPLLVPFWSLLYVKRC